MARAGAAPVERVEPVRVFGAPVCDAAIRCSPEDFLVAEELGFLPSGDGEHDFLDVRKTGANTAWVARALARAAGVAPRDVGYAGLKDRHAVTRQWFSVRRPSGNRTDWHSVHIDGVEIVGVERNARKLRRGAHRGNRFRIALRGEGIDAAAAEFRQRASQIAAYGVPNYFGEQRFGRALANLDLARSLFGGRRLRRDQRSYALSAARSFLFNAILTERAHDGTWDRLLPGEIANLDGSGSVFPVAAVTPELDARVLAADIHPTATLWGEGAPLASADAARVETGVAARFPDLAAGLENARIHAASRALRVRVSELSVDIRPGTAWLEFYLPKGAYATTVLAQVVDYESRSNT